MKPRANRHYRHARRRRFARWWRTQPRVIREAAEWDPAMHAGIGN